MPVLMATAAAALAFGALRYDAHHHTGDLARASALLTANSAEGARQVLSTIAGSMITVAGVVFSITTVVLTLASQQYGPRLLRTFMSDAGNQIVLGSFTSIFLYNLLILRTVRGTNDDQFVPHVSVAIGVCLAVFGVGVLIYFIHHVSIRIQAAQIIAAVARDLQATIDQVYPEQHPPVCTDADPERPVREDSRMGPPRAVWTLQPGYIRRVELQSIVSLAARHDLLVELVMRPGGFTTGGPVFRIWPGTSVTKRIESGLRDALVVGPDRTPAHDPESAFDQFVEVAIRALSPAINDPFTAGMCLDRIAAGLVLIAQRPPPPRCYTDAGGRVRLQCDPVTLPTLVEHIFGPLRQYGAGQPVVVLRMLECLGAVLPAAIRPDDRRAIATQAERIVAAASGVVTDQAALDGIRNVLRRVLRDASEPSESPGLQSAA